MSEQNSRRKINMKDRKELEEQFVHQGDILHPLGVMQAVHLCNDELTKEEYSEFVKRNYGIETLNDNKRRKIDYSWNEARRRIERIGLMNFSDDNRIKANFSEYLHK